MLFSRANLLHRYLLRRVLIPSAALVLILLMALVLERLLRLIQLVTEKGAPIQEAMELLAYLLPHYLGMALPAGLFMGTILGVRSLHDHSELVVMRSVGVPVRNLLKPQIQVSGGLCLLMLILTGVLQPHSRYQFRMRSAEIGSRDLLSNLKSGTFQHMGDQWVLRAGSVLDNGEVMERFFAVRQDEDGRRLILSARRAERTEKDNVEDLRLNFSEGMIIHDDPYDDDDLLMEAKLTFERFSWQVKSEEVNLPYGPRGQNERELTYAELLAGGFPEISDAIEPDRMRAEFHSRMVHSVSLPVLAVLAFPLALLGSGRSGKAYGTGIGVVLIVIYHKFLGFGETLVANGTLSPWIGLWVPWIFLILLTVIFFYQFAGDRKKSTRGILRRFPARGSNGSGTGSNH